MLHRKLVTSGGIPGRLFSGKRSPAHCDKCLWLLSVIGNSWIHSWSIYCRRKPMKASGCRTTAGRKLSEAHTCVTWIVHYGKVMVCVKKSVSAKLWQVPTVCPSKQKKPQPKRSVVYRCLVQQFSSLKVVPKAKEQTPTSNLPVERKTTFHSTCWNCSNMQQYRSELLGFCVTFWTPPAPS